MLRTECSVRGRGDRMTNGTGAPSVFGAGVRTLDSDVRCQFRHVVEGWADCGVERERYAARLLVGRLDAEDDLRAVRESRGAVADAVPYAEAEVAIPELVDLPWETSRFEELIARLGVAGETTAFTETDTAEHRECIQLTPGAQIVERRSAVMRKQLFAIQGWGITCNQRGRITASGRTDRRGLRRVSLDG